MIRWQCLFGIHKATRGLGTRCACGAFKYPGTGWFYPTRSERMWKYRKEFRRG